MNKKLVVANLVCVVIFVSLWLTGYLGLSERRGQEGVVHGNRLEELKETKPGDLILIRNELLSDRIFLVKSIDDGILILLNDSPIETSIGELAKNDIEVVSPLHPRFGEYSKSLQ